MKSPTAAGPAMGVHEDHVRALCLAVQQIETVARDCARAAETHCHQVVVRARSTDRIEVHFPIGHRARREEGIPVLKQKFVSSVSPKLAAGQWQELNALCADQKKLAATDVDDFMALLVV